VERGVRDIYETSKNVKSGNQKKKWLETAQVFYGEAVSTIRNHFEGICNYFISRSTSGVMEGLILYQINYKDMVFPTLIIFSLMACFSD